jgi:ribonuclease VapC
VRTVVDTSALVAVLFGEADRLPLLQQLEIGTKVMSAGSVIELLRVVGRRAPQWRREARQLLDILQIEIWPVDREQVDLAEDGMARFGKGRGAPPAVLNFGDLFAYALARHLDAPLLFKGDDFRHTDVKPVMP